MRETPGSLHAYFILAGVLVSVIDGANLAVPGGGLVMEALALVDLLLAIGLLVVGILAVKLLRSALIVLHIAVWSNYAWFLLLYGLALVGGAATTGLHLQAVAGAAIGAYLSVSVVRLRKRAEA